MCETLPPFGECGLGVCVNGSCVCNEGYSQNLEFFYKDLPPAGTTTFCDYSASAMTAAASILLVLTLLSLILQLFVLEKWNQARRLLPMLIGYLTLSISLIWRIVRVDDSLFGYDAGYSFFLTTAMFLLNLQQIVFLNKYVLYAINVFRFKNKTRKLTQVVVQLQNLLAVLVFFGMIPVWTTSVVESQATSGQLIAAANVIFVCAHTGFIISGYILFTKYISDLLLITKNSSISGSQRDTAFLRKCRKTIPRMRFVRETLGISNLWSVASNLLALTLPGWLKLWVFLVLINFFLFEVSSLIVIISSGKAKLRRPKLTPSVTVLQPRNTAVTAQSQTRSGSQPQPQYETISKDS